MVLDCGEDLLLTRFLGDIERKKAALGQTDVSDDCAVRTVVEVKEGAGFKLELGGPRFTQFAELAKLVQEISNAFESSSTTFPRFHELPPPNG